METRPSLPGSKEIEIQVGGALTVDNKVLLPTLKPSKFLLNLWHELGHYIGKKLSFMNGQVLTPNEVKKTFINFDRKTRFRLYWLLILNNRPRPGLARHLLPVAFQVIDVFSKGHFDPLEIKIVPDYPYNSLVKAFVEDRQRHESSVYTVGYNGELVAVSSPSGRNQEIPAVAVEAGCNIILRNSLGLSHSFQPTSFDLSHERATNIVKRAYQKKDASCLLMLIWGFNINIIKK